MPGDNIVDFQVETSGLLQMHGTLLDEDMGERFPNRSIGWAIILADHGEGGFTNYVSSIERESMIKLLRETADYLERGGRLVKPLGVKR